MTQIRVWDVYVRIFHWATVVIVGVNYLILDEGKIHEWLGYILAALLAGRVVWGLFGKGYARFSTFPPSLTAALAHLSNLRSKAKTETMGHNPVGALMVYNLLIALFLVSATGYMATTEFFGA